MDALATYVNKMASQDVLVTDWGALRISRETAKELDRELPGWRNPDKRTKIYKAVRQVERDFCAIAEAEWCSGGDVEELEI